MNLFKLKAFVACFFLSIIYHPTSAQTSNIILTDNAGKITYLPYTDKGDILPDFSYCGYRRGGIDLPVVKTVFTISPVKGDNTKHIQNAINKISNMPIGEDGYKGALLLKEGRYEISGTIRINSSGIVLKGEKEKTELVATTSKQYTLIEVGEKEDYKIFESSRRKVIAKYVPSGTRELLLNNTSSFKVGDDIIVERPSTQEWISYIGMDRITPLWQTTKGLSATKIEQLERNGLLNEDKTKYNFTKQWEPGSKNLKFQRKITAIINDKIILDIPLTNALQQEFGGAEVYKYAYKNRINEVGIQDLVASSLFDKKITKNTPEIGDYYADEEHGWTFLKFVNAENSWVDHVESSYFSFGFVCEDDSRFITIQNCKFLDPVSIITGGRRYGYLISGQGCLVNNSYSRNGRHDFVLGALVAGPNAFVNSKAELCHAATEPHQRWATGCLWDNISLSGPSAYFSLSNRGNYGSGHGWAGAQMVLWNCIAPLAVVMSPPSGQNFSFGMTALTDKWSTPELLQKRVNGLNKVSGNNLKYKGLPTVGDGFIFSNGSAILPKSLYWQQLKERLKK